MEICKIALALCMGIALAASCGFRVFVPLLVVSLAVKWGGVHVSDSLAWIGSDIAIWCLGTATLAELLGYYIPWVDNALDAITGPLALVAGTVIMSGMLPDLPAYMQWGIGIVGGAGAAGAVQASTTALRGTSTATTAGVGNFVVSTGENIMATVGSVLAVVAPILAVVGLVILIALVAMIVRKIRRRKNTPSTVPTA